MKIKDFPKGIRTIRIPFIPNIGSYDQLYERLDTIKPPKSARRIEASITVSVDLKKGETSYQISEITVSK